MSKSEAVQEIDPVPAAPETQNAPITYLLVDGENIDATLGSSILRQRPSPEERPRWDRVLAKVQELYDDIPVRALFFLNATVVGLPIPFIQALNALGYRPIPLSGPREDKVVDIAISRTLRAIAEGERPGNVVLVSHDGDFRDDVMRLLNGRRRVGLIGFREFVNSGFRELVDTLGLQIFDLEDDTKCFNQVLPRVRVIEIESYDPTSYLDL